MGCFFRDGKNSNLKGIHTIYGGGWSDKGDACCSEGGRLSIPKRNRPVHSKPNPVRLHSLLLILVYVDIFGENRWKTIRFHWMFMNHSPIFSFSINSDWDQPPLTLALSNSYCGMFVPLEGVKFAPLSGRTVEGVCKVSTALPSLLAATRSTDGWFAITDTASRTQRNERVLSFLRGLIPKEKNGSMSIQHLGRYLWFPQ